MKLEYTKEELSLQTTALEQLFDTVRVVDPYRGVRLDPATLEPCEECGPTPAMGETGRGIQLVQRDGREEMQLCQGIRVEGRPCVLVLYHAMPHETGTTAGAKNSYDRALAQYREDIRRDYVTGVYNSRFIHEEYRAYAEKQAAHGMPVGAVVLRVNEYWDLCNQESLEAAERCLNSAAGILQLAVGTDQDHAVLARLEDGLFAAITVGAPASRLAQTIQKALEDSRRVFNISLSRRGTFTVSMASAEWAETASWEMMLSLAQQRL
ncbi:MAG: hypothetical protein DBX91_02665 [Subdoligranulum variabile]|nr:MAG: hypothetical protein DBX91_02665 [Subdoligranulum variabile]